MASFVSVTTKCRSLVMAAGGAATTGQLAAGQLASPHHLALSRPILVLGTARFHACTSDPLNNKGNNIAVSLTNNDSRLAVAVKKESRREYRKFKYHPNRDLVPPSKYENMVMPERHRLPIMPRTPNIWTTGVMKPPRQTKELWRMRGEEMIKTDLVLNQFGIIALTGGMLRHPHFELLRMGIGRHVKTKTSFAIYRVDPPYKPLTDHGFGKRMGGGKGRIKEYGTPIKAGRIIVEVGGKLLWEEVQPWLSSIAGKMPFEALAVNAEQLARLRQEERRLEETNLNPISFEWMVRNNMLDCQRQLSEYDKIWFGKYAYLDRTNNMKFQDVIKYKYRGKK